MDKQTQNIIDEMADKKNRSFANSAAKLSQAKYESKFWGSPRGVMNKLPEAIVDTTKRVGKGIVNYAKRLTPTPKGGKSPNQDRLKLNPNFDYINNPKKIKPKQA